MNNPRKIALLTCYFRWRYLSLLPQTLTDCFRGVFSAMYAALLSSLNIFPVVPYLSWRFLFRLAMILFPLTAFCFLSNIFFLNEGLSDVPVAISSSITPERTYRPYPWVTRCMSAIDNSGLLKFANASMRLAFSAVVLSFRHMERATRRL